MKKPYSITARLNVGEKLIAAIFNINLEKTQKKIYNLRALIESKTTTVKF
jgi:hypothetical protein